MIPPIDLIGTVVAALLTLFVFSYLLGDLPGLGVLFKFLYRLAMHILVGAGVAYALAVAVWSILYLRAFVPLLEASYRHDIPMIIIIVIGVALGAFLVLRRIDRRVAFVGNYATSYLVGVGLGVSAGGALVGTVFTQTRATAEARAVITPFDPLILLLGTLLALIAFSFTATARRGILGILSRLVQLLAGLGRIVVYFALGAAFAGAFVAGVSVLAGRLQFLIGALPHIWKALTGS
jgi:hypothetical protein